MNEPQSIFIPFETGIPSKLKKCGFDDECFAIYNHKQKFMFHNEVIISTGANKGCISNSKLKWWGSFNTAANESYTAPTYDQVIEWFETNHNLVIDAFQESDGYEYTGKWTGDISRLGIYEEEPMVIISENSRRNALEVAILEAIKIIQSQGVVVGGTPDHK